MADGNTRMLHFSVEAEEARIPKNIDSATAFLRMVVMDRRTLLLQFLLLVSLSGCVERNADRRLVTTPSQVVNFTEGTRVRANGYLIFESHARQLWSSEDSFRRGNVEHCFTLINTRPHERVLTERSRLVVRITGRTFRDVLTGNVDFGACSERGLYVDAVE